MLNIWFTKRWYGVGIDLLEKWFWNFRFTES